MDLYLVFIANTLLGILLLLEFIRSMYWWNPLVRLLINEVVLLLETHCDFQASKNLGKQQYQNELAELILQTPGMNSHRFVNSMNGNKNTNIKRLKNLNKDQTMNLSSKLSYSIICLFSILILSLPFADIGANEQPTKIPNENNGLLLDFEITKKSIIDERVETEVVNVSVWTHFDTPTSIRLGDKWALELMIFDHAENVSLDMKLREQMEIVADPKIMFKIGDAASLKLGGENRSLEIQVTAQRKAKPG